MAALAADHHGIIPTEASLRGYWLRLGMPRLGSALAAVLVLGCGIRVWRRRPDPLEASGLAIAVTILAAPLSWFHYTLFLIPALLARPWGLTLTAGATLLCIPVWVPLLALLYHGWGTVAFGAIYVSGVLLILVAFLRGPGGAAVATGSPARVATGAPALNGVAPAQAA